MKSKDLSENLCNFQAFPEWLCFMAFIMISYTFYVMQKKFLKINRPYKYFYKSFVKNDSIKIKQLWFSGPEPNEFFGHFYEILFDDRILESKWRDKIVLNKFLYDGWAENLFAKILKNEENGKTNKLKIGIT